MENADFEQEVNIPDGDGEVFAEGGDEEGSLERLIIPNQEPSFDMDEMMKSIEKVMIEKGIIKKE